jgi:predicted dehydrogenase
MRKMSDEVPAESPAYGGAPGAGFVREFLRATETGEPGPATVVDALRIVEILEAIYASARERRVTPVQRWEPERVASDQGLVIRG